LIGYLVNTLQQVPQNDGIILEVVSKLIRILNLSVQLFHF
jgi:hypothetical protein